MFFDENITQWNSTNDYSDIFEIEVKWKADMEVTKDDLRVDWRVKEFTPE